MQKPTTKLGPLTAEEDARITAAVEADPDTWILTEEDFAQMRPMAEVDPGLVAHFKRHGVIVSTETLKNHSGPRREVTVNIDTGLAIFFKQLREGGEDLLNDMLRHVVFDEELEITRCKKGVIYCSCDNDPVVEPESESALVAS